MKMLLLCVFVALAAAQGTSQVTNSANLPVQLTRGYAGFGSVWTTNEQTLVYEYDPDGAGTRFGRGVYSVPASGSFANSVLLSQSGTAINANYNRLSPNEDYVLFTSAANTGGTFAQQFSVPIGGGTINLLNPTVPSGGSYNLLGFKPCSGCSSRNDQSALLYTATTNVVNGGTSRGDELWTNSLTGNNLKKLSVPINQPASDTTASNVNLQGRWNDFLVYYVVLGATTNTPTRSVFLADWNGNNWQMSPAPLQNSTWNNAAVSRQPSGCNNQGRYIAFLSNSADARYPSVYVYDTSAKTLLNGGAPVNPTLDTVASLAFSTWSSDNNKLYFTQNVNGQVNLYEYNTQTPTTVARIVNGAYSSTTGSLSVFSFFGGLTDTVGDYLVYQQNFVSGNATSGLFSYNTRTGGAPIALSSLPDINQATTLSGSVFVRPGTPLSSANANTAYILYKAITQTTPASFTELFSVPVIGGTPNKLNVAFTQTTGSASVTVINPTLNTGYCPVSAGSPCSTGSTGCSCASCTTPSCSNYVFFTATDSNGLPQLYSAQANGAAGSALLISPAGSVGVTVSRAWILSSNVPYVTFSASPSGTGTVNLYLTNGAAAAASPVSSGIATPAGNSTASSFSAYTTDGQYMTLTVETSKNPTATAPALTSQSQLFLLKYDGTGLAQLNPSLQPTETVASNFDFSRNNQFIVFTVTRNALAAESIVTSLYSANVAASPSLVNLSPAGVISTAANPNNPISTITERRHDPCSRAFFYQTTLPNAGTPAQYYSVGYRGGNTVLLSQSPTSGLTSSNLKVFINSFRVAFNSNPAGANDFFTNSAIAALSLPSVLAVLFGIVMAIML